MEPGQKCIAYVVVLLVRLYLRWGTWIEAALFYAEHFDKIKEICQDFSSPVVQSFKPKDAAAIKIAQEVLQQDQLAQNLMYIKAHLSTLPPTMRKLETVGLTLNELIGMYTNSIIRLKNIPGDCGAKIRQKISTTLQMNLVFSTLSKISSTLNNDGVQGSISVPARYWSKFKYAQITSCDVERSFFAYKLILTAKRHQLTTLNLEKMLVIYCRANYNVYRNNCEKYLTYISILDSNSC